MRGRGQQKDTAGVVVGWWSTAVYTCDTISHSSIHSLIRVHVHTRSIINQSPNRRQAGAGAGAGGISASRGKRNELGEEKGHGGRREGGGCGGRGRRRKISTARLWATGGGVPPYDGRDTVETFDQNIRHDHNVEESIPLMGALLSFATQRLVSRVGHDILDTIPPK